MTKNLFAILFAAFFIGFSSCQEEENTILDNAKKNVFINPYDYVGYHHNLGLDFIFEKEEEKGEVLSDEEVVECIVTYSI